MLLGISGSLRTDSSNSKLIRAAAKVYGGPFTESDLNLPLYNGDLETADGVPDAVQSLAEAIKGAEAVIVSTPEYNQSLSGVLKNALDWVSRTKIAPWRDKPVAIMSAAAGRAGGARASYALRLAITPFRPRLVSGPDMMLANSNAQFDDEGHLTDERAAKTLGDLIDALKAEVARG